MVLIGLIKITIGIVAIAICIAVYRHRVAVGKAQVTANTALFGKLGEATARGSTPKWIGFIAITGMAIGSGFVIQGVFNLFS